MAPDATTIYLPKSLKKALDDRKEAHVPYHVLISEAFGIEESKDQADVITKFSREVAEVSDVDSDDVEEAVYAKLREVAADE